MVDAWGDGWNGNYWHWTPTSGVAITGTLASGSAGTAQLCIPPGTCAALRVDDAGAWVSEVSWTLTDPAGATVVSGVADNVVHEIGGCPAPPTLAPTVSYCNTVADGTACTTGAIAQGS